MPEFQVKVNYNDIEELYKRLDVMQGITNGERFRSPDFHNRLSIHILRCKEILKEYKEDL